MKTDNYGLKFSVYSFLQDIIDFSINSLTIQILFISNTSVIGCSAENLYS